jgi:hypothetical protein
MTEYYKVEQEPHHDFAELTWKYTVTFPRLVGWCRTEAGAKKQAEKAIAKTQELGTSTKIFRSRGGGAEDPNVTVVREQDV